MLKPPVINILPTAMEVTSYNLDELDMVVFPSSDTQDVTMEMDGYIRASGQAILAALNLTTIPGRYDTWLGTGYYFNSRLLWCMLICCA
jgi:hypothetical protein